MPLKKRLTGLFSNKPKLTLSDKIVVSFKKSMFDPQEKSFLPADQIDNIVTREAIREEFQAAPRFDPEALSPEDLEEIIDFVETKAKRVFAISCLSNLRGGELVWAMCSFSDSEFVDTDLPFKDGNFAKDPFCRDEKDSPWADARIHNFKKEQWSLLAPVFSPEHFTIELEPEHILPFTRKESTMKQGGFGQVFQVDIHPAHQKDPVKNVRTYLILDHL